MEWGASLDYFSKLTNNAPWYIWEPYQECKIDYSTFEKLMEADAKKESIEVNIYDAIRKIYGLKNTKEGDGHFEQKRAFYSVCRTCR